MSRGAESQLDRLYGLALDEFTRARNEAARQTRAQDPEAAEIIARARKPTQAAWAVNQLARREPKQVQALLRTADRLRSADGEQALRKAMREQREAVEGLVRTARERLDLPQAAVERVRDTLAAATIEAEARGLLERGRFTKERQAVGFGPAPTQGAASRQASSRSRNAGGARQRRSAERRLDSARERLTRARAELEDAVAAAQGARAAVEAAQSAFARAEREEAQARSQVDKLD